MVQGLQVLSFDCYGTLIDWERGLEEVFRSVLAAKGSSIGPGQLLARWEPLQFALIQGPYQPYREILKESLAASLASYGLPYDPRDGEELAASMPTWEPFPDVPPSLRRLKQRYQLAVISNTDRDIIAGSIQRLGVPFDQVVTAMDARCYKPQREVFQVALQRLGVPASAILHIAFGFQYDIGPAGEMGFRTLWLNRKGELPPAGPVPDYEAQDFYQIVRLLGV